MLGTWFWHFYAQIYDALNALLPYQRMLDDVIDAAAISPGMRLLDAGCGTGNLVWHLQARGTECGIVAVDACPAMLARARRKCLSDAGAEFHLLDLNTPFPFAPASFDIIIGCNVLYAVHDAPLTLQRLAVLLKPGGRMVYTVPRYGYNMGRVLLQHLREATWRKCPGFIRQVPALVLVLACNLLIFFVYFISHPLVKRVGHRKLRCQQLEEIRAYLHVEGCSLSVTKTYAEQNWLLCYEKKEALTLVYPCIGRFPGDRYVRSWQMQPLAIATLAGMTPPEWEITFFDDRMEPIGYETPADLVGISIETFTARRGYQIADEYRKRGVPVVLGGYHATFCPDEALAHADAVCVGEAEGVWSRILGDAAAGTLAGRYDARHGDELRDIRPDRRIFAGKPYFALALVETGRGCTFQCNFCSISAFHQATYRRRPIEDIVAELRALKERYVFFVDDNMIGDTENARALFHALQPLGIKWVSQASINVAHDEELLRLMVASGCIGLLIGFESLNGDNLAAMGKRVNRIDRYHDALARLRQAGIVIYGTFVFGYPHDTPALFAKTVQFARQERLFLAAFNHVVPFPGTPLYREIAECGQLHEPQWWLSEDYRFGQVPFHPRGMTAKEIEAHCFSARTAFYGGASILQRGLDLRTNCGNPRKVSAFFGLNFLLHREVAQKRGIPLGLREEREAP